MKKRLLVSVLLLCSPLCLAQSPYTIKDYLNIRSANGATFSSDGKSIAYLTNESGTMQIWTKVLPNGVPHQVTRFDDNVGFVRWLKDGGLLFGKARGGDENTQFFWIKPDGTGLRALTDEPDVRHNFDDLTPDGKTIVYTSNKRDRNYFDVYMMDLATSKETLVYQKDANLSVSTVNDGATKFIISRDGTELSLDNDLFLYDASAKSETPLTTHTGAAEFGSVHFTADGFIFGQNDGREFASLSQMRKKNAATSDWNVANREVAILDETPWDVGEIAMNDYGSVMAYSVNRNGFDEIYLRKYDTDGKPLITVVDKRSEQIKLPGQGVVTGLTFNADQSKLAFTFSSASRNANIWIYDLAMKSLSQVTRAETSGMFAGSFIEPKLVRFKTFDGRDISAWYYEPARTKSHSLVIGPNDPKGLKTTYDPIPVIVSVHGGPEGQERPGFNALYQYYLSRGYGILAPNVRGSTGYGKSFTHLDDVKKREDSVRDLTYAVEWLKKEGGADPDRIAIIGGSYGGYMTLAAITLYPEIWAAAVDTVGIANFESFLTRTSGYRRRQREVEYGRLDRDLDFLRSISPLAKVDRIKCPLFVIAGKNDPRVPYTEAEQIVGALKKRGATVQYKLYEDEGHGVSKLKNRLELYPQVADFLDTYMRKVTP